MKKVLHLCAMVLMVLLCSCSNGEKDKLVGKWIDNTTEQTIEYTHDGYYYEYINESFTSDKTKYKVSNDKITYYIDDEPESEFSVEYVFGGDDTLIIGGVLEYRRLKVPESEE